MPTAAEYVLKRVESSLSHAELAGILELQADEKFKGLILRLKDTGYKRHTLSSMCRASGVSYLDVANAVMNKGKADGIIATAKHLPQIMEDIAIDAKSREVTCPLCEGDGERLRSKDGEAPTIRKCLECDGTGKVRKAGDPAARKSFMEGVAGFTAKLPPQTQNNTLNLQLGSGELEDTLKMLTTPKQPPMLQATEVIQDAEILSKSDKVDET